MGLVMKIWAILVIVALEVDFAKVAVSAAILRLE